MAHASMIPEGWKQPKPQPNPHCASCKQEIIGRAWRVAEGKYECTDCNNHHTRVIRDMLLYLSLNEGEGVVAHDDSGHGFDAAITAAVWVDSKFGKALSFDGTDAFMLNSMPTPAFPLTVSFWMKRQSTTIYEAMWWLYNDGIIIKLNDHKLQWYNGITYQQASQSILDDDRWHHVLMTDPGYGNGNANFYIDGVLEMSLTSYNTLGVAPQGWSMSYDSGGTKRFGGLLDEIRIYPRILTDSERRQLGP